jgi:hypothetical protein
MHAMSADDFFKVIGCLLAIVGVGVIFAVVGAFFLGGWLL